jgi:hypothetical protein
MSARRIRRIVMTAALAAGTILVPRLVAAQTQVLVVTGLGGERRFTERFRALGASLVSALHSRYGVADADIVWFGEDSANTDPRYRGPATREALDKAVAAFQARATAGGQAVVVFIGHGAGADAESRLSSPGPDVTVADVQRWLAGFPKQRTAFVALASGSGDMLPILAAPGRVVITATKTSFERNESRFGEFFVRALTQDVADVDKDGRVSLLEAFRYAQRETKRTYDDASKLQTEHAQLDDDGSRQNTADPPAKGGQGTLARRYFLDAAPVAVAGGDAALAALYREQFELEVQVDSVRARKARMPADAYMSDLERALVALARKAREIRTAEGRP